MALHVLFQNDGSQKDNWFHHAYEHNVLEKINTFHMLRLKIPFF